MKDAIVSRSNEAENELARNCYGHGCWNAKHWFVGLEQGLGRHEKEGDLTLRLSAFQKIGVDGLSDCREFHKLVPGSSWHRSVKPPLQPTWRGLILLLATFKGTSADTESLRIYQRDEWGRADSETCVIELSGIPARSLSTKVDRYSFRRARMDLAHKKMVAARPYFVVIYGKSQWDAWRIFWKESKVPAQEMNGLVRLEFTTIAFAPSPTSRGLSNEYWQNLARRLRSELSLGADVMDDRS